MCLGGGITGIMFCYQNGGPITEWAYMREEGGGGGAVGNYHWDKSVYYKISGTFVLDRI